jgi:mono/diheme cytochrome c family protein
MAVSLAWRILTLFVAVTAIPGCDRLGGHDDAAQESEELAPALEEFPAALIAALPDGVTPDMLREGRKQYGVCAVCHGAEAEGTQLGPPFRGAQWMHSDGTVDGIEQVVRSGVEQPRDYPVPMPPMGGGAFDDDQIRALATYVYALSIGG